MEFHNYYRRTRNYYLVEFHDIDKVFVWLYNMLVELRNSTKKKRHNMVIAFVGHSFIPLKNKVKEMVKEQIRVNIIDSKITCYIGGYGDFDEICACACRELKEEYVSIEAVYVTPYISLPEQAKIKAMQRAAVCAIRRYIHLLRARP